MLNEINVYRKKHGMLPALDRPEGFCTKICFCGAYVDIGARTMFHCPNCGWVEERDPKAARIHLLEYMVEILKMCIKDGSLENRLERVRVRLKTGVGGGGGGGGTGSSGSGGGGGGGGGDNSSFVASEAWVASSHAPVLEIDAPRAPLERLVS